jgi:hypothetical protein
MPTQRSQGTNAHRITAGARFGLFGNCVIIAWLGPSRSEHRETFDELMREAATKHAQGVVMFVALESGAVMTDAGQRRDSEAAYARWATSIRAVAQVVEGGNLWAATARSVMTATRLVERRPYPTRVFSDPRDAARWCTPHLVLPLDQTSGLDPAETLLHELRDLRAQPGARMDAPSL